MPYLDHRKILKFYAFGCFETDGLPLWILQFDFQMHHQLSFQSYDLGTFDKQTARHEQRSLFFDFCYFPRRTLWEKKKSFRYNSKFASHKKWGWCSTKKKGTRIICKLYACVIFKRRFQFFFFRPSHDGASRWRIRYFRPGNHNPVSRIIIIILYSNTYAYKHAAYLKRWTARLSLWKVPWLNFKNIKNNEKRA